MCAFEAAAGVVTVRVKNSRHTLAIYGPQRTIRAGVADGGMRGGGERGGSLRHSIVAIVSLLTLIGCGATRSPSPGDTRITGLMSDADRTRLGALAQQRIAAQSDPDQGYRIGPDDLLEITIPDLIDAAPYRDTKGPAAVMPAVASVEPAPSFRQGVRVTALGDVSIPQLGIVP